MLEKLHLLQCKQLMQVLSIHKLLIQSVEKVTDYMNTSWNIYNITCTYKCLIIKFNVQISNQYSSDFRHKLKVKTANCCPDHSLVISVSMRLESYVCLAISASLHCFNESNSYNPNGLQHEIIPRSKTKGNNCLIQPGCGHRYET